MKECMGLNNSFSLHPNHIKAQLFSRSLSWCCHERMMDECQHWVLCFISARWRCFMKWRESIDCSATDQIKRCPCASPSDLRAFHEIALEFGVCYIDVPPDTLPHYRFISKTSMHFCLLLLRNDQLVHVSQNQNPTPSPPSPKDFHSFPQLLIETREGSTVDSLAYGPPSIAIAAWQALPHAQLLRNVPVLPSHGGSKTHWYSQSVRHI